MMAENLPEIGDLQETLDLKKTSQILIKVATEILGATARRSLK